MENPSNHSRQNYSRKEFILDSLKIAGASVLIPSAGFAKASTESLLAKEYSVQEVIDVILTKIPGTPYEQTVDTIKAGSPGQKVTGIITTMFATVQVINEAVRLNANFIIAHEPTFYNHTDDKNWVKQNEVVKRKIELLERNKIAVWRFHDYCHALKPDAISYGVAKKAGWLPFYKTGETILRIPAITLEKLIRHLKSSLDIAHVKVIGDPAQNCERIALLPGAWGGQNQITTAEVEKPDVLVVGEVQEWETAEYIRDAGLLGSKTALIILGHSVSEEPGMEWLVDWLKPLLPGTGITHIASGDPFRWM